MIPPIKELPSIIDSGVTGLRLQGTSAKALPGMPVVDLGGKGRMQDAAQKAAEMKIAYSEDRARAARMKATARIKDQALTKAAETRKIKRR